MASALLARAVPALAQQPRTPAVWYRAASECPNGADFLDKIGNGSARAHLAEGGDHIDFVVTLLTAQGETIGRLERQTNSGTVAIRELRDATCARVADALAMSLGLAIDPDQKNAEQSVVPPVADATSVAPPTSSPTSAPPAPAPSAADLEAVRARPLERTVPVDELHDWIVGLDAGLLSGVATKPMFRGSVFVSVDHVQGALATNLALRFAVVGALGTSSTEVGPVRRWLVAGRGELCPWRWGSDSLEIRPCAAFELGETGASSERATALSDHALWAAPGLGLRAHFAVLPRLSLEAGAGALAPLIREQLYAGSERLVRDSVVDFYGTLGISVALP